MLLFDLGFFGEEGGLERGDEGFEFGVLGGERGEFGEGGGEFVAQVLEFEEDVDVGHGLGGVAGFEVLSEFGLFEPLFDELCHEGDFPSELFSNQSL